VERPAGLRFAARWRDHAFVRYHFRQSFGDGNRSGERQSVAGDPPGDRARARQPSALRLAAGERGPARYRHPLAGLRQRRSLRACGFGRLPLAGRFVALGARAGTGSRPSSGGCRRPSAGRGGERNVQMGPRPARRGVGLRARRSDSNPGDARRSRGDDGRVGPGVQRAGRDPLRECGHIHDPVSAARRTAREQPHPGRGGSRPGLCDDQCPGGRPL
jgi:hypothetical protein